jgi:hypothetical protein
MTLSPPRRSPLLGEPMMLTGGCGPGRKLLLQATSSEIAATDGLRRSARFIVAVSIRCTSLTAPRAPLNLDAPAWRRRR